MVPANLFSMESEAHVTAALRALEQQYPHLQFWTDQLPPEARLWFARGSNGHPWLVMSDDLSRFTAALNPTHETAA
jgi:hypothetical protein